MLFNVPIYIDGFIVMPSTKNPNKETPFETVKNFFNNVH